MPITKPTGSRTWPNRNGCAKRLFSEENLAQEEEGEKEDDEDDDEDDDEEDDDDY